MTQPQGLTGQRSRLGSRRSPAVRPGKFAGPAQAVSGSMVLRPGCRGALAAGLCLAMSLGGISGWPPVLVAQDRGAELSEEEGVSSSETGSPATPNAAAGEEPRRQRTVLDTVMDGGFVGLLIILLSTVSLGFIVEHFLTIRKSALMPDDLMDQLDELLAQGQIDQALEVCQQPESQCLISHVVSAGLERYKGSEFGFAEYKAAVEEAGEDQTGGLYRKTEVLGLIGSIAPMLGLTGTVLGMIKAFNTIAESGGMARPDELAGGIGQALVTTLMGLVVAIPTMIAFSFFRNKIDSLVAEAGKRVEQIMMPLGRRRA